MSRIIKFEPGGKTPRTFQYLGQEYDQDAVLREYHRRKDDWIRQHRYNRKQAEIFNRGFRSIANLLGSSKISRESDGSWSNSEGISSTGEMDTNIFGGIKKTENNEINLAAALLDDIMKTMPSYTKPASEKKKDNRSQYNLDLKDAVSRKYMPGGFDKSTWERYDPLDSQTKKRGNTVRQKRIAEVLGDIINQVSSQDFDTKYILPQAITDKNKWINNLRIAQQKLADGTLTDEDYTALAQTGFSGLDELLGISTEPVKSTSQGSNDISDIVRTPLNSYVDKVTFKDNNGETHTIYTQTGSDTPLENGWVYPNIGPWDKRSNLYLRDGILYDETSTDQQYQDALRWRYPSSVLPTGRYGYGALRDGNRYSKVSDLSGYFEGFPTGRFLILSSEDGRDRRYVYKVGDEYYEVDPNSISQNPFDNIYTGKYLKNGQPEQFRIGKLAASPLVSGLSMLHFDPNDPETYTDENLQSLFPLLNQGLTSENEDERNYALNILSNLRENQSTYKMSWDDNKNFISYRDGRWFVNNKEVKTTNSNKTNTNTNISEELRADLIQSLKRLHISPVPEYIKALKSYREIYGSDPWNTQQLLDFNTARKKVQSAQVGAKIPEPKKTVLTKSEKAERSKIIDSYDNPANASISDLTSGRDDAFNMTWEDKTRLVTAMTDLIGVGLGMVPGANLVATATGIGSSIGQATADYSDDRVSGWDATINLLANLGMDAISIVPIAKSLKGVKAAKSLIKYIPMIGTAVAASNTIENKDEIMKTLGKIKDGDISSLTKADFRNLSTVASTIFGVKRIAKYGDSKRLFGKTPTNKSTIEYINKKTGERGTIELDNSKIQGGGRKGNVASAKAAVVNEVNKSIKAEADKLKVDDIDVNTNVFGYLKSSKITGDVSTSQNWRRLWQKYQETKGLRDSDLWIANKLNLIDRIPSNRRIPISTNKPISNKNGGVLKFQSGGQTMSRPERFRVNTPQTYSEAMNPKNWSNYFYNDRAIDTGLSEGWFENLTADQLNELIGLKNNIGTISAQSDGTYKYTAGEGFDPTRFNTAYNQYLGKLNQEVYGVDPKKFKQVGPSTWNRAQALEDLKKKEIQTKSGLIKWDPITNKFITEPLSTTLGLATSTRTNTKNSTPTPTGNFTGGEIIKGKSGQFLPEDAIALGRALGTAGVINWSNNKIKSAIRPFRKETYENYIPQTENYLVRTSAYNQIGELGRQGERIATGTSDPILGALAKLEASRQGRQIQLQADQINSQRIFQTGEQGRAESNAAKARRIEAANAFTASANQVELAKAQMDAQNEQGIWMRAFQPWLAGIENRFRTHRAMQRQLDSEEAALESYIELSTDRQKAYNDYKSKYEAWKGNDASKTEEQYRKQFPSEYEYYQNRLRDINTKFQRDSIENQRINNTLGNWMFRPLTSTTYAKSGAKLTAQDRMLINKAKDFNKALIEQQKNFLKEMQSVRKEHGMMIRQLSAFTANLIKSAMSWK